MRKKNFKGRCEKRVIGKCAEVCRTYDAIQYAYADLLQASDEVVKIRCNVLLDGLESDGQGMCLSEVPDEASDGEAAGRLKGLLAAAWCIRLGVGY